TVGGCLYCLYDLDAPRDQGCSCFGILTYDRKPKLACWDVGHMWRDFEITVTNAQPQISYQRDYWARDCKLTITPITGKPMSGQLADLAPGSSRSIPLSDTMTNGFRWTMDFQSHGGLVNQAAGAWPAQLEEADFLERLMTRDTFPFLKELFDAQVLTVEGKPA